MNLFALKFIDVYLPLKNHFALQIPKSTVFKILKMMHFRSSIHFF